jgi:hypothetical protein
MERKKVDLSDPIVDELHRIREEMFEEAGCDIHEFGRQLMESQKRHGDKLVYLGKDKLTLKNQS